MSEQNSKHGKLQLSLKILLATVAFLALSFSLMATSYQYHSELGDCCFFFGAVFFGASVGLPIGYAVNRGVGAAYGAVWGAIVVAVLMFVIGFL